MDEGAGTNLVDDIGSDDITISGATWTKSLTRPVPSAPTQQTIDISGLGYTNAFYYREYLQTLQNTPDRAYAQTEVTVDYTGATTTVKTVNGVPIASVKKVNGVPIASVKKINGVSNT